MRTQTEQNERTLEEVAPGERGVILQVGNENGPVKRRLVDMGLTPGTEVTVRKVAPFGDPVELNLRGYELSLRKADAAQIRVATGAEGERRAQTRRRGWSRRRSRSPSPSGRSSRRSSAVRRESGHTQSNRTAASNPDEEGGPLLPS